MIHVFHGFLGSPSDFEFLGHHDQVILHDLYDTDPESVDVQPEDTLIGYSMGGRIAMEIAHRHEFNIKKLVIMNSHPGLTEEKKKDRSLWENSVIERLKTLSAEDFLSYWNKLPLFSGDMPLKELSWEKFNKSEKIFDNYRLSKQRCFLPELHEHREKVLWIAGLKDQKYADLARDFIMPLNIHCVFIDAGHRLYQEQEKLMAVLKGNRIL